MDLSRIIANAHVCAASCDVDFSAACGWNGMRSMPSCYSIEDVFGQLASSLIKLAPRALGEDSDSDRETARQQSLVLNALDKLRVYLGRCHTTLDMLSPHLEACGVGSGRSDLACLHGCTARSCHPYIEELGWSLSLCVVYASPTVPQNASGRLEMRMVLCLYHRTLRTTLIDVCVSAGYFDSLSNAENVRAVLTLSFSGVKSHMSKLIGNRRRESLNKGADIGACDVGFAS